MKLLVLYFLSFFVLAVTAASVGKLNGVSGSVKIIDFDLKSDAFIVSQLDFAERLYKLESQNQVIFTKDFVFVVYVKFNSKNDAFIFEQIDEDTRNVWVLSSNSIDISNVFNYSASSDLPVFFDHEDNLFLDTTPGIAVVRNGGYVVDPIPRLSWFHLITKDTYDIDTDGDVFLGVRRENSTVDKSLVLKKAEIIKPDPRPYYFNIQRFGKILAEKLVDDSLYLCQDSAIIRYRNENVTRIDLSIKALALCDFYVTNNRIFVNYIELDNFYLGEIKPDDTVLDLGFKWGIDNSFDLRQTSDKYGTVFFGTSSSGSSIEYIKVNDGMKLISIPNSLFIFGLTANDNGSLWILAQDLYLVPFGQTEAVKINGLPYAEKARPFKAKPGTNDVFIGSDEGVFIGTI